MKIGFDGKRATQNFTGLGNCRRLALEALNSRVPVVPATGSCLEEAGGPGLQYVAPFDIEAIVGLSNSVCSLK